jgi:hypothetical protein
MPRGLGQLDLRAMKFGAETIQLIKGAAEFPCGVVSCSPASGAGEQICDVKKSMGTKGRESRSMKLV